MILTLSFLIASPLPAQISPSQGTFIASLDVCSASSGYAASPNGDVPLVYECCSAFVPLEFAGLIVGPDHHSCPHLFLSRLERPPRA